MMRLATPTFLAILVVALGVYAFDCGARATPEQAMQCCNSMPCSSHGQHNQDCCKSMPAMAAPFVQPASVTGVCYSAVVVAKLPATSGFYNVESSNRENAVQCHAPPILGTPVPQPLRI